MNGLPAACRKLQTNAMQTFELLGKLAAGKKGLARKKQLPLDSNRKRNY